MTKDCTLNDLMDAIQGIVARLDERERRIAETKRQIHALLDEPTQPARLHLVRGDR